jgi:hypothetical protein
MLDKNKAVVCCLLATSAIMLSEKKKRNRKMWSKKWYLKRNISCDAHLLNELLETDVPWDDAIVVTAGKLRKLWDSLNELRSSLCERRLKRTVLRPALLPVKTAQFTQFSRQVWRHTVKSLSLTESVWGTLDLRPYPSPQTPDLCALQTDLCPAFIFWKKIFHCVMGNTRRLIWHTAANISMSNFQTWAIVWRYNIFRKYF